MTTLSHLLSFLFSPIRLPVDGKERKMNIKTVVKKNGQTVYRASVYLGVDQMTGKKARTTVTALTKSAIKIKAREVINEFAENGYTTKKRVEIVTYNQLFNIWWDSYKNSVKPNTQQSIKGLVKKHLLPVFGVYRVDKITTPLIQTQVNKWASKANQGEKGAFLNYPLLHNVNTRIFQYGVSMQVISINPAREVVVPRKVKHEEKTVKYLNDLELKKFLNYMDQLDKTKYKNLFDYTLYNVLLATGCRISEILALEWSDIDFKDQTISITKTLNRLRTINSPKSKSGIRSINIDAETVRILEKYHKRQRLEAMKLGTTPNVVFSTLVDDYAWPPTLLKRLSKHFKGAGVSNVGFHGFRHTHASLMANCGIEPKILQHRMGHSTLAMTMDIYSHLSEDNAKKAVSYFETAINNL